MAENTPRATSGRVLLLFAFLFAGLAAAVWHDRQNRERLESVTYPTALGDTQDVPAAVLGGADFQAWTEADPTEAAYHLAADPAVKLSPDRFLKIGAAADGAFWIYRPDENSGREGLYIRAADGRFLPVAKR